MTYLYARLQYQFKPVSYKALSGWLYHAIYINTDYIQMYCSKLSLSNIRRFICYIVEAGDLRVPLFNYQLAILFTKLSVRLLTAAKKKTPIS